MTTTRRFLACKANPATRLSIPAAMRAKGIHRHGASMMGHAFT
jgi:hypothetical protein